MILLLQQFLGDFLFLPLLLGVIFILTSLLTLKFPPKKINLLYGYRTSSSMKSQERWDFAQKYSGKLMLYLGFGFILLSTLGLFIKVDEIIDIFIGLTALILSVIILIVKTENAIKKNFKDT